MNTTVKRQEREVRMASLSPIMEEILAAGGSVELTVTGNSMRPMLLHKVSRVRLLPPRHLSRGDLPLYRRDNGQYVLHRVVDVENDCYTCCGDNQWHLEPGIRQDQIVAVVSDFCRKTRWRAVSTRGYTCYWRIWVWIRPLRRLFFGGLRRIRRWMR